MEITEFFSWELAGTVSGAAAIVWILISALKGVLQDYWSDKVQRIAALAFSVAIMSFVTYQQGAAWGDYILAVINGAVVSLAVMQFETVTNSAIRVKQRSKKK